MQQEKRRHDGGGAEANSHGVRVSRCNYGGTALHGGRIVVQWYTMSRSPRLTRRISGARSAAGEGHVTCASDLNSMRDGLTGITTIVRVAKME
jgi:hypothetical protein